MVVRSYMKSVDEVFSCVGGDRKIIKALAYAFDTLKLWKNPDDEDYRTSLKEIPQPYFFKGKMMGNKYRMATFEQDFAAEVFSHEIRSHETLDGLAGMYKRLKAGAGSAEIPSVVFQNVLLKMLWLSSGRQDVKQAA